MRRVARWLPLALVLAGGVLARTAEAAPGDAVVAGALRADATFQSIGVAWAITGDANRNAGLTLEFRRVGEVAWRPGAVAMKSEPTTIVDGAALGLHQLAASALLLDRARRTSCGSRSPIRTAGALSSSSPRRPGASHGPTRRAECAPWCPAAAVATARPPIRSAAPRRRPTPRRRATCSSWRRARMRRSPSRRAAPPATRSCSAARPTAAP